MEIKHHKKMIATAFLALLAGPQLQAGIVGIDDFDQTTQLLQFNPPPGGPTIAAGSTDFNESEAPEAIGNFRDLFIQTDQEISFNDSGEIAVVSTQGQVQVANTVNSQVNVAITWDGNDAATTGADVDIDGLGGVDLIDGTNTGLLMDIDFADLGVDLTFNIWDTSGNVASVSRVFSSQVQDEQVFFAYSDLVGDSVDLTNVGAIQLLASGPQAYDVDFSLLQSVNPDGPPPPTPVSAPATLSLVGLGMLGATLTARRRKR